MLPALAEIGRDLDAVDNVRSVETFVVYKSFNLKVPLTGQTVLVTPPENG
jgi:hypothetical protein